MKRTTIAVIVLLVFVGAAGAFASGSKEAPAQPGAPAPAPAPGFGPCGMYGPRGAFGPQARQQAPTFSQEKVTVTGTLHFENLRHPELKSGGKTYELMVPRFYLGEVDLKDGATVTVEGYTVTGMPYDDVEDKDDIYLRVAKVVIDGKEYDLEAYAYGPRMRAPGAPGYPDGPYGPGMMGPRGRGDWGPMPYHHRGRRW